jgi:predicted GNAT family acetyltransferase
MTHPLDRPVWNALLSGWRELAEGSDAARRLRADYGPFAAVREDAAALAPLVPETGALWIAEREPAVAPPGARVTRTGALHQMLADRVTPSARDLPIVALGEADAAEMRVLAALTRPGPFEALTHRFGGFLGIRVDGRLVAMAGRRMRLPGFTEVSGVCTHPDHRGGGYAGELMRQVMAAILASGEQPFLHAYAANAGAIALYETLGFRLRAAMTLSVIERSLA